MRKFFLTLFILVVLGALLSFLFGAKNTVQTTPDKKIETTVVATSSIPAQKTVAVVKPITPKTSLPKTNVLPKREVQPLGNVPLVHTATTSEINGILTSAEVLQWTNKYRADNGLPPLVGNATLDSIALLKARDMFARQYFEHVSPTGKDVIGLAEDAGYAYILIGENLAYGNFTDAKDLVDAWMASPGHRANILKAHYEEIGIAVLEGNFHGNKVWMAVQEFGRPSSSCPMPALAIKNQIDADKAEVATYVTETDAMMTQMNALEANKEFESYNALVPEYNALIEKMNSLIEKIGVMVGNYNWQIAEYKKCVEG